MTGYRKIADKCMRVAMSVAFLLACLSGPARAGDLLDIQKTGKLRHLGVPYANFVSGAGDGLDVELMQLFARHIGVEYEYVKTDWQNLITDLTGIKYRKSGNGITILGEAAVKGDIIANGLTVLDWREQLIDFSTPTFPTQVWLMARADSAMEPIHPSDDIQMDISNVRKMLKQRVVIGITDTCTDPRLYDIETAGATTRLFDGTLNELAPAVINGVAEATILDVPDALVALEKWPGQIKVIGPVSPKQEMGCGFAKNAPLLRAAFNDFFEMTKADGTYYRLVKKYYPAAFLYFPEFFAIL